MIADSFRGGYDNFLIWTSLERQASTESSHISFGFFGDKQLSNCVFSFPLQIHHSHTCMNDNGGGGGGRMGKS